MEHEPTTTLPIPPPAMRHLVGPIADEDYDHPQGARVFGDLPAHADAAIFDFGCGCGRVAHRLIQQRPQPARYLGIDLHPGMIDWCQTYLTPTAPQFRFLHHNVHNYHFNPDATAEMLPFPASDREFTLAFAISVFTHLTEGQSVHYLGEIARILRPDGFLVATWFLFDKRRFPMLHEGANALYQSYIDPSAAVIYDYRWLERAVQEAGLTITRITPPTVGRHWWLVIQPAASGMAAQFPAFCIIPGARI
jgi:SAM-dependent methyltransferase